MGFSGQEYWSGLPFPSPGDLPHLGIEPMSPALAGSFFTIEPPEKPQGTQGYSLRHKQALPYQGQITVEICLCVISWQVISLPFSLENYL